MRSPRLDATCLLAGLTAAVACGLAWGGVVILTGYEVSYLALAVGAVVGWAVTHGTRERGFRVACAAAGLAVLGIACGKYVTAEYGLAGPMSRRLQENEDFFAARVCIDELREMVEAGEAPAGLGRWLEDPTQRLPPAQTRLAQEWLVKAAAHFKTRPEPEQEAIFREYAEEGLAQGSAWQRVMLVSSRFDVLWILLALTTAFQAGLRGGEVEDTSLEAGREAPALEEVPVNPRVPGIPAREAPEREAETPPTRERKVIKVRHKMPKREDPGY